MSVAWTGDCFHKFLKILGHAATPAISHLPPCAIITPPKQRDKPKLPG
jgi:hypothetical protein